MKNSGTTRLRVSKLRQGAGFICLASLSFTAASQQTAGQGAVGEAYAVDGVMTSSKASLSDPPRADNDAQCTSFSGAGGCQKTGASAYRLSVSPPNIQLFDATSLARVETIKAILEHEVNDLDSWK